MIKRILAFLPAFFLAWAATAQSNGIPYTLIITHASLVDAVHNQVIKNRLVAISGQRISAIDTMSRLGRYKALRYVDAKGQYLIPGLWDMHIHLRGGKQLVAANKKLLPLFLVNGITTVRECGGDMTDSVLQWRKMIEAGTLAGPKIYTAGRKIDGPNPTWAGSIAVQTAADVSRALDTLQQLGVDFVKVYDSKISREAYLETIGQAQQRGLTVTGHMPFTVELREAVDAGLDASEHLYYVFKACSAKEDSITEVVRQTEHSTAPLGLFGALPALYNSFDNAKAHALFAYLAKQHCAVVPTLAVSNTLQHLAENDHASDTLLQYIDPGIQATYAQRFNSARRQTAATHAFMQQFEEKATAMVPQLYAAGVMVLAGSDCGASNSFVYPGTSLHDELKLMVAAGLTPAQALCTSTVNGSAFMKAGAVYGSLGAGKSSDLVILAANPLENINAIDQISFVLAHGKLYDREDLDQLLKRIKQ